MDVGDARFCGSHGGHRLLALHHANQFVETRASGCRGWVIENVGFDFSPAVSNHPSVLTPSLYSLVPSNAPRG